MGFQIQYGLDQDIRFFPNLFESNPKSMLLVLEVYEAHHFFSVFASREDCILSILDHREEQFFSISAFRDEKPNKSIFE
jgi:hypothetical protein